MGSSDSLSFPSEPPDIGNWFSSYVYESPELSSIDDFKDCSESRGNDLGDNKKEKEENLGKNEVEENRDVLLVDVKKASSGNVDSCGGKKFTSEDLGSSGYLSFSSANLSEPPDIKNWFSSYKYESPVLDSSDAFMISDHSDNNSTVKENDALNNTNEKEEDLREFPEAARYDLAGKDITSAALVKYIHKVKDNKNDDQQVSKHCDVANRNQSFTANLRRWENDDNGSTTDLRLNRGGENRDLDGKSGGEGSNRLLEIENDSDYKGRKSPRKLISVAESFRAKHSELVRPVNGKSSKEATGGSNEKENYVNEFPENGFVSTRKSKSIIACDENYSRKPLGCQSCSSKAGITDSLSTKKDALVRRKVLSETTNVQPPDILEIPGKWRCPQKNKPDLGPPLKQLRLEQWIRRA